MLSSCSKEHLCSYNYIFQWNYHIWFHLEPLLNVTEWQMSSTATEKGRISTEVENATACTQLPNCVITWSSGHVTNSSPLQWQLDNCRKLLMSFNKLLKVNVLNVLLLHYLYYLSLLLFLYSGYNIKIFSFALMTDGSWRMFFFLLFCLYYILPDNKMGLKKKHNIVNIKLTRKFQILKRVRTCYTGRNNKKLL